MANLDSVKIKFPNECINSFSTEFIHKPNYQNKVLIKDELQCKNQSIVGLNQITIDNIHETTTLELSAKILKSNYIKGINQNTITEAINNINNTGVIDLNVNKIIDFAEVLRCDVTDNIKPESNSQLFYKTLSSLPIPRKYETSLFNTKTNLGVVWKGNQKSFKERQIFYDKCKQLATDKLLRGKPYASKIYNDFKEVVRVETNLASYKTINQYLGSRQLNEVLTSNAKVNYCIFSKITKSITECDLKLFTEFEGMKFGAIRKRLGDEGIIKLNNYDWNKIEHFIRTFNPNNYRHYKNELKHVYNDLKTKRGDYNVNIIEHVKELLLNVA